MKGRAFGDQQIWPWAQNNEDKAVHAPQSLGIMNQERDMSEEELKAILGPSER